MKKIIPDFDLSGSFISIYISKDDACGCTVSGSPKLISLSDREIQLKSSGGKLCFKGNMLSLFEADKDCFMINGRIEAVFLDGDK